MDIVSNIDESYSYEEKKIISSLLRRFLQSNRSCGLYTLQNTKIFDDFFLNSSIRRLINTDIDNQIVYTIRNQENEKYVNEIIKKLQHNNNIIVFNNVVVDEPVYNITDENNVNSLSLYGPFVEINNVCVADSFKVLAIIHVFNESDVIEQTTEYLLSQGIDVFLVDNWSTDDSYTIIQKLAKKYATKVFYKRFPEDGPNDFYDWYHQLELTEKISKETDYSWYIHYDADEYRMAPWQGVTLKEAIAYIDFLGFNVIENTVIDFKITESENKSIFMKDTWFDFGHRPAHFEQTKTWKKSQHIDLKSSGGHIAKVNNPKVFPLKFLNRHYPLRSYEHAIKKIFTERKPRFEVESKKRGWHGHYNKVTSRQDIIVKQGNLFLWNKDTFMKLYIPLFTGCGIRIDDRQYVIDTDLLLLEKEEPIILYGAGKMGQVLYEHLSGKYMIESWVDRAFEYIQPMKGRIIEGISKILESNSRIVIAIENEKVAYDVINGLTGIGIEKRRIIWRKEIFEK